MAVDQSSFDQLLAPARICRTSQVGPPLAAHATQIRLAPHALEAGRSMPILPICDSQGRMLPTAPVIIFGAMLFPEQPDRRRDLLVGAIADALIERNIPIAPQIAQVIREMPSKARLKHEADHRFEIGAYVGLIYCTVLSLAWLSDIGSRASVNTVCSILNQRRKNKKMASKRTLEGWWALMAPTRHLWAAWLARGSMLNHFEYLETDEGPASHTAQDDLRCFLREAMETLELGAAYKSPASTGRASTLIDRANAFGPPAIWPVPNPVGPFGRFRLREPAPELLDEIQKLVKESSCRPHKPRLT
jgi:hypothetical protein